MRGYKLVTSEYRPPIRGGDPIWDGTPGFELPRVRVDTGSETCSYGWNFCLRPETAARIGGFWPDGHPSVLLEVESVGTVVERGDKCRAESLRILGVCDDDVWLDALRIISEAFAPHSERMAESQMAWRTALGRPRRNVGDVERGLKAALRARGLNWELRRFDSARDAWAARAARAAWAARDARDAWAARDALTVEFAAINEWTKHDPLLLTTGLRGAYEAGLAVAVPTGPDELGYAMKEGT